MRSRLLFSGLNAALLSISGTSSSDIYAVGGDPDDGLGPYVLHYDGSQWQRLESGATGALWWISVAPISGDFFMAGTEGKVLRFDPVSGVFTNLDGPGEDVNTTFGVWGPDHTDLWAVGGDLDEPDNSGFIWRFDGNDWTVEDLSDAIPEGVPILYKVWGRSASDVFAVGRLGVVLHFDGTTWARLESETTQTLFTVHGDEERVFAVGGFLDGAVVELEGATFVDRTPAGLRQLNGVYVPHGGEAVAVGIEATLARRTDGVWTTGHEMFDTVFDFHGTWVDPSGGVWAVGGNLTSALDQGIIAYSGAEAISTTTSP